MRKRMFQIFEKEASFTLEAAYITPIIIIMLFCVMWFGLRFHDIIVIKAWENMLTEEARMAVQYKRIPYENTVNPEDMKDEECRDNLCELIKQNDWDINKSLFSGNAVGKHMEIYDDEAYVKAIYSGSIFKYYNDEEIFGEQKLKTKREFKDPVKASRSVKTAYRVIRKILEVKQYD